jgi:Ca2+-binding RTX toxin-like protein
MLAAAPTDTIQLASGYSNETATVTVNNITVNGGAGSLGIVLHLGAGVPLFTATGAAPINVFDGSGDNGIVGNAGNNLITVTGGVDAVNGGLGTDRLIVDYHLATGAVTGDSTSNFTESGGGARSVTITNGTFEHFTVLTGAAADTLTTGAGDDLIRAGDGANTITAGQGRNIIYGGADADTITALDGGNCIVAGNGANTVTTGNGSDTVSGGNGADTITTGGGADRIHASGGADTIVAGTGTDRLTIDYSGSTTSVTHTLTGSLAAGYGGILADGSGLNTITFTGVEDFNITAGRGNDVLATGGGRDVLSGGSGNDFLNGGAGADKINGGSGADVITGGLGIDVMTGGAGSDSFNFMAPADSPSAARHDRITDFHRGGADTIDLSAIDAHSDVAGDQPFIFLGTSAFTGAGGELHYSQVGGNTIVSADIDGDLAVDFVLQLDGLHALAGSDFVL